MSESGTISVRIDATDFKKEMTYEVGAFRSAVEDGIAYKFVRLLTTEMLYPRNESVISLLEGRSLLRPSDDGVWTNRFHFDCAIEYHLLQAGRLVRLIVNVPSEVEMEIDISDPKVSTIVFRQKWRTDILDPILYEGNEISFREPFYLSKLTSRPGTLSYVFLNAEETVTIELEATYDDQLAIETSERQVKLLNVSGLGAIIKAIGMDAFKVEGPCSSPRRNRLPRPPTRDGRFVYLHVRLVDQAHPSFDEQVRLTVSLLASYGFNVVVASQAIISDATLLDIDVGRCWTGEVTSDQRRLFSNRTGIPDYEVAMYFIRSTVPPLGGCAAFEDRKRPSCIVARNSARWTAAHELGHVLGLFHVDDNRRLMTRSGTANISEPPPDLINSELSTIQASNYSKVERT